MKVLSCVSDVDNFVGIAMSIMLRIMYIQYKVRNQVVQTRSRKTTKPLASHHKRSGPLHTDVLTCCEKLKARDNSSVACPVLQAQSRAKISHVIKTLLRSFPLPLHPSQPPPQ